MSLTQYIESQEDQDMTRLPNFLELKRGKERGGVYSSGGENMNRIPFNEG